MARKAIYILLCFALSACKTRTEPQPAPSQNSYVDSSECASCQPETAESYKQTGMGQSLFRLAASSTVEDYVAKNTFYHERSNRYYEMKERDGQYFMRRYQKGADGKEVNSIEQSMDY